MFKRTIIVLFSLFVSFFCFAAPPELPSIFSDHMVLQRQMKVPVWGKADAGATVTVEFAGQKKTTAAGADGNWRVDLDPMEASAESRIMTVTAGADKVEFADVLVGEVWLASGQSNMQWAMFRTENAKNDIAEATHPLIRLYNTPVKFSLQPESRIDASWTECTSETVPNFSAVAYFFGRKLQRDLNVPIGLWHSSWGGTKIEPWMTLGGLKSVEAVKAIYEQAQKTPELTGNFQTDRQNPTLIYNAMLHANVPFAIRGAIWYQGEANRVDGMLYVEKTRALLNGWYEAWGYEFPYYLVQLAPFNFGWDEPYLGGPVFWEAQAEIVKQIPNTGMIVVNDTVIDLNNIHPPNKIVPGERLALLAEAKTYGMNVVHSGPVFEQMKISGNSIIISFTFADGLTTRDSKAPDWFEIAGKDGIFKPATVKISENTVILSSPEVENPAAMRFAWHKNATPNLMNAAGLPASAFRAGQID